MKSIGTAETLEAGTEIDEGKTLDFAYSELLELSLNLNIAVESNNMYALFSKCHSTTDRSIRA